MVKFHSNLNHLLYMYVCTYVAHTYTHLHAQLYSQKDKSSHFNIVLLTLNFQLPVDFVVAEIRLYTLFFK